MTFSLHTDQDDSSKVSESDARTKFALRFPRWSTNLSSSAKDLLHKLLDIDPKKRWTAEQVLIHPWVLGTSASKKLLASPGKIGERRKELQSPKFSIEDAHERMRGNKNHLNTPTLDPIDEKQKPRRKNSF